MAQAGRELDRSTVFRTIFPRKERGQSQTVTSEKGEVGYNRDIQEQAQARTPWVKLGTCCSLAQALGCFYKWLQCQGGNSNLTPETAGHGTVADGKGRLTVCFSSRRVS